MGVSGKVSWLEPGFADEKVTPADSLFQSYLASNFAHVTTDADGGQGKSKEQPSHALFVEYLSTDWL